MFLMQIWSIATWPSRNCSRKWKVRTPLSRLIATRWELSFPFGRWCNNQECASPRRDWHEIRTSGALRGNAIFTFYNTSNAKTLKRAKTYLWLVFCAHQNSEIKCVDLRSCFWRGFCACKNIEFQTIQKSASRPRGVENHDTCGPGHDYTHILFLPASAQGSKFD